MNKPAASGGAASPSREKWLDGGAAVVDADCRILHVNDDLSLWLGLPAENLTGLPLPHVMGGRHPDCGRKLVEAWHSAAPFARTGGHSSQNQDGAWYQIEVARHPSGGHVRINTALPPLKDLEEGGWNERLDSEESQRALYVRLLLAETRLDNLAQRWPGVLFSQRADFSFSFIGGKVQDLTGLPAAEWRDRPRRFWELVHEADAEDLQKQIRGLTPANRRLHATYRVRHAQTGRISYVYEHREAVFAGSGLLLGYEGVWLDVTRQTIAERRLSSAAWKETLAVLTMGLAHDFCNVMAGIISLSESLEDEVPQDHPFRQNLKLIRGNSLQANQLVQRILSLHQGKAGERNYHELRDVLAETVEVAGKVVRRRIEMLTELHESSVPLFVDAFELRQVLLNLTLNAADAMPDGGKITFTSSVHQSLPPLACVQGAFPKAPVACISVRDTGVGIPERHLRSIFDPFFTTKAMNKGSGLGLYNARLFVEKHGGAISVESVEGRGTTFNLWLPVADFTEGERDMEESIRRRHTLLLVGGLGGGLETTAKFLREHGFYTVVANPPERALETLHSPDYHFSALVLLAAAGDGDCGVVFSQEASSHPELKRILLIQGCNEDEVATTIITRADLIIPADTPETEMIQRVSTLLG